jgi:Helix-turn-helix domain
VTGDAGEWLTLAEVAARLEVSVRTVQRWTGQGLRSALVGRRRVTRQEWLDAFLLEQADERELDLGRRVLERTFGRVRPPRWLVGVRLVCVAVIAISVGERIADDWRAPWHPLGLDIDSLVAITVAVAVVLVLERLVVDRLGRRLDARAFARARARAEARELEVVDDAKPAEGAA